jgi:hypothetical protein
MIDRTTTYIILWNASVCAIYVEGIVVCVRFWAASADSWCITVRSAPIQILSTALCLESLRAYMMRIGTKIRRNLMWRHKLADHASSSLLVLMSSKEEGTRPPSDLQNDSLGTASCFKVQTAGFCFKNSKPSFEWIKATGIYMQTDTTGQSNFPSLRVEDTGDIQSH